MRGRQIAYLAALIAAMTWLGGCGGSGHSAIRHGRIDFTAPTYTVHEDGTVVSAITLRRSAGDTDIVSVTVVPSDITATGSSPAIFPPDDYDNAPIVVTWIDGDTVDKTITIPILNDHVVESNEDFLLTLTNPTGGVELGSLITTTVTILDDDSHGELALTSNFYSANEDGTGINAVTVRRTGGNDGVVTATLTFTNGSATGGVPPLVFPSDYSNVPILVTFGDQDTTDKVISIPILNDTVVEGSETFLMTLGSPTGGVTLGAQTTATFTIIDDDVAGVLSFTAASYGQNEDGSQLVPITVRRTGGNDGAVSATITFGGGTATAGVSPLSPPTDYDATPITVNFADQDTTDKVVFVQVLNDTVVEADETFIATLGAVTGGASLGTPSTATYTITNDDVLGSVSFTSGLYTVNENNTPVAPITVRRTGGNDGVVTVTISVYGGTATPGPAPMVPPTDFTAGPYTVTFSDQDTADKILNVPINDDDIVEGNETVFLRIDPLLTTAPVIGPNTCVLTIVDDDAYGAIELSAATYGYDENNGPVSAITVRRTGGIDGQVTATLTFTDGTANSNAASVVEPVDYVNPGTVVVTFADQDSTDKVIPVTIVNDAIPEQSETFQIALSAPTGGATLGAIAAATVTITDGDGRLTLNHPAPHADDALGRSLAKVGLLIAAGAPGADINGTPDAGSVVVFDPRTGASVATLIDAAPISAGAMGSSVAAAGADLVVGAPGGALAPPADGRVMLFNVNTWALRLAINNPSSTGNGHRFGASVAASNGLVYVGAPGTPAGATLLAGAVYVFDQVTGSLLRTIAPPIPATGGAFGETLAVSGTHLAVGSPSATVGGTAAGAVYVFDVTTGSLLVTIPNPFPSNGDEFGISVAWSGTDIVAGSPGFDVPGSANAGIAFVFDGMTGILSLSIPNPTPTVGERFGAAVARVGNRLLIGAPADTLDTVGGGAVYIYSLLGGAINSTLSSVVTATNQFGAAITEYDGEAIISAPGQPSGGLSGVGVIFIQPVF